MADDRRHVADDGNVVGRFTGDSHIGNNALVGVGMIDPPEAGRLAVQLVQGGQ